ncbi:13086_t:CDS:2 [Cetraspora pellucida]|uniref:N-acetylglucosamine-6-phosphate deacetylase n=1 Tax=Cetraspora pellucida TaxID=1433469 RepID=A0A9N9CUT9_9GLOM|nr:13086_t:CDS:2 [Cetraspora pellucida]
MSNTERKVVRVLVTYFTVMRGKILEWDIIEVLKSMGIILQRADMELAHTRERDRYTKHALTNTIKTARVNQVVSKLQRDKDHNCSCLVKIVNARLIRNHKIIDDDVLYLYNGKIIDPQTYFFTFGDLPDVVIDAKGLLVAPGFIDVQINGAFGVDFSQMQSEEKMRKGIDNVAKGLLKYGCTSFVPTIISSGIEVYQKVLPFLKPRKGNKTNGAEILGVHVEGPFIEPSKCGAHEESHLRSASGGFSDFVKVYGLNEGKDQKDQIVKIVTVAPEVEGVSDSLEDLVRAHITVSLGHSSATVAQAELAVEKGARFITHLFNAMQQFHHRDPGIIGLLGTKRVPRPYYGIICDGIHVHQNSIKMAYDSHPEGAVLVTDAMAAMGLPPGDYTLGDIPVRKIGDERVEVIDNGRLAGSVITIDACVRNFREFTGCSIIEAVEAATLHPAELLGIQNIKGTLNIGADADLVFLDDDLRVMRQCISNNNTKY